MAAGEAIGGQRHQGFLEYRPAALEDVFEGHVQHHAARHREHQRQQPVACLGAPEVDSQRQHHDAHPGHRVPGRYGQHQAGVRLDGVGVEPVRHPQVQHGDGFLAHDRLGQFVKYIAGHHQYRHAGGEV